MLLTRSNIDRLITKLGLAGQADYEIEFRHKEKHVVLYKDLRPVAKLTNPTILELKSLLLSTYGK